MIKSNPFTSETFISYWSKHFLHGKEKHTFNFAKNLSFYQSKIPGLYLNAGKNLTKGIDYELNPPCDGEEKGKTLLIHDVIDFSRTEESSKNKALGLYTVKQYPGFMIKLDSFGSLEDFMTRSFKKSSRYKLRKYKKRLEECFPISFKVYHGEMSEEEFGTTFDQFRLLLEKRFAEKKISNNNLDIEEWNFYKDVAYPMILEKKAALFVLKNNNEPISLTLAYLSEDRVFDAITVFDIDYAKFHLGSIKIMYLIEWCISNNWPILDFSKGYFDYKTRWSNEKFDFAYHILYDKKSPRAQLLSFTLKNLLTFKQYLREKKLNDSFHRFTYALKNNKENPTNYSFVEHESVSPETIMNQVDICKSEFCTLKGICFDFLYLYQEQQKDLKVFKVDGPENIFFLVGQKAKTCVKLTT
ncbi:GNAT family N-acetyltransferase [Flagellimonas flava]|uniref:Acetyltransferase (GNAT) domain-containing protein n=1 Tax=Flagellimonas flava TaxID=570519 RepID=A0A1M5J7M8_9FLAO|nr:GNAT family N-acetyltransferase [Allomuricauda flava]SHG36574.1 Acetyltransferase (GNAT) domain-containing protein [Allomuricauda flava]